MKKISYLIYLEKNGNIYLKVGKTSNWYRRKHQYKESGYTVLEIIHFFKWETDNQALEFEDVLRDYFKEKYRGKKKQVFCPKDRFLNGYVSQKDLRALKRTYKEMR